MRKRKNGRNKPRSQEVRLRIAAKMTGRKNNPAGRNGWSAGTRQAMSAEERESIGAGMRRYWAARHKQERKAKRLAKGA